MRDIETPESVVSHSVALGESPEWGFLGSDKPKCIESGQTREGGHAHKQLEPAERELGVR